MVSPCAQPQPISGERAHCGQRFASVSFAALTIDGGDINLFEPVDYTIPSHGFEHPGAVVLAHGLASSGVGNERAEGVRQALRVGDRHPQPPLVVYEAAKPSSIGHY